RSRVGRSVWQDSGMKLIHQGWSVAPGTPVPAQVDRGWPVPATVPGCVHTDLLAAGRIPDPYLDRNEEALGWIGYTDWVYETRFDAPRGTRDRVDLVFQGLDTVATVELNGTEVGRTANMHRSYRFPVRDLLHERDNRLRVTFASACRYA